MGDAKVVTLHLPPLTDVPNRLRWMADEMDKGAHGEVMQPDTCTVILTGHDGALMAYGYGREMSRAEAIGVLTMAATAASISDFEQ